MTKTPVPLAAALTACLVCHSAHAWDPPDGPAADQVDTPATPTTLLPKAHGYIIQNGITILQNEGYWTTAQTLRDWQQELLNGVRYADKYQGDQSVDLQICEIPIILCQSVTSLHSWPLAADNHYYNPDTGRGLQAGYLQDAATWLPFLTPVLLGLVNSVGLGLVDVRVNPSLRSEYPTALSWLDTEFGNAQSAYQGGSPDSINGRTGMQLAMFYLGWASHFLQDLTVVHHTFDQALMHHSEYEAWADADTTQSPPVWNRAFTSPPTPDGVRGIYVIPPTLCPSGAASCFGLFASLEVHNHDQLVAIDNANGNDTSAVHTAIPLAEALQAGLFAHFFTAVGQPPLPMPAMMAAFEQLMY